jgi:hypothetical protein
MLFVGMLVPLPLAWYLIAKARADLLLSLLGLISLPLLIWGASLGAKIGPCEVGDCMSSTQHSHLVVAIAALVILAVAFFLLARHMVYPGGIALVVAELVGVYSMLKTDAAAAFTFAILAAGAAAYLGARYSAAREAARVPDFPPAA